MLEVGLHVGFKVSAFVIFKITILGDELVRFLSLLLLQHRVSHFHIFAAELVSGQELHNAGSDRVSQNIGCGTQTVPTPQGEKTERVNKWETCGTQVTPANSIFYFLFFYLVVCR